MRELNITEVDAVSGAGLLASVLTGLAGPGGQLLNLNVQAGSLLGLGTAARTTLQGDIIAGADVGLLGIVQLGTDAGVNA